MGKKSARLPTIGALLTLAVLGLSGAAMPLSAAGAAAEALGTVAARKPAEVSVPVPAGGQRYFLALTVAPTRVERGEGYAVAVYDSAAGPPSAGAKPLAVFSFFPPPQVGKAVEFVAPLPAETVAARGGNGQLALTVTLVPVEEKAKLENSALEIRSVRLRAE